MNPPSSSSSNWPKLPSQEPPKDLDQQQWIQLSFRTTSVRTTPAKGVSPAGKKANGEDTLDTSGIILDKLFIEDGDKAYKIDRDIQKELRFEAQRMKDNQEIGADVEMSSLLLANKKNTITFNDDQILIYMSELEEVYIRLEPMQLRVKSFTRTGPYPVSLPTSAAEILLDNGTLMTDAAISFYFELGNEYFGKSLGSGELSEALTRIKQNLSKVAIIKFNRSAEELVGPKEVGELQNLKFISMGLGKRPITTTMPAEARNFYDIHPCCFATECIKNEK
ncbi:MAG: hypothetical protein SGPRY_012502, partial [Prymnesium sp.]